MTNHPHNIWYRMALGCPGSRDLINVLKIPYELHFETIDNVDKVWFEVNTIDKKIVKIYFPSDDEVQNGLLKPTPELVKLLNLRKRIIDAIGDLRTIDKIRTSNNKEVKQTYIELIN